MLFGFFSLVLVLVYWVNRAVILFDQLIADGQSAGVFLEFTALSLPNVIRLVLPLSGFAATVYVTNRLSTESELTVMQATGHSAFRLARPVVVFGLSVTALMLILTHLLVPSSLERLSDREDEISENITARLLSEGSFLNPSTGITFYIREITPEGELLDIFLADTRDPTAHVTYTASTAFLLRTDNGPQLVMFDGMAQTLSLPAQTLITATFDDSAFDIGALMASATSGKRNVNELTTLELLFPTPALETATNRSADQLIIRGHRRFLESGFSLAAALIGFSTLLTGGFSRFGVWRQILMAIFLLIVLKTVESVILTTVGDNSAAWPLIYTPIVLGLIISWLQLYKSDHPRFLTLPQRGIA
jgi:lipopolysaccharide export system permease protein